MIVEKNGKLHFEETNEFNKKLNYYLYYYVNKYKNFMEYDDLLNTIITEVIDFIKIKNINYNEMTKVDLSMINHNLYVKLPTIVNTNMSELIIKHNKKTKRVYIKNEICSLNEHYESFLQVEDTNNAEYNKLISISFLRTKLSKGLNDFIDYYIEKNGNRFEMLDVYSERMYYKYIYFIQKKISEIEKYYSIRYRQLLKISNKIEEFLDTFELDNEKQVLDFFNSLPEMFIDSVKICNNYSDALKELNNFVLYVKEYENKYSYIKNIKKDYNILDDIKNRLSNSSETVFKVNSYGIIVD